MDKTDKVLVLMALFELLLLRVVVVLTVANEWTNFAGRCNNYDIGIHVYTNYKLYITTTTLSFFWHFLHPFHQFYNDTAIMNVLCLSPP